MTAAIEEDVDVIATSILSGAHLGAMAKIMKNLEGKSVLDQFLGITGGSIPRSDIARLKEMGVVEVFPTASSVDEIVGFVRNVVLNHSKYR